MINQFDIKQLLFQGIIILLIFKNASSFHTKPFFSSVNNNIINNNNNNDNNNKRSKYYSSYSDDIEVIDCSELNEEGLRAIYNFDRPVILRNVYSIENEMFTEELMARMYDETIEFDIRGHLGGEVEQYESTLADFIAAMIESRHGTSFYYMDESIMSKCAPDLEAELELPQSLFGKNYFEYFPSLIRPRSALIMGGFGSRSFLHADPYEWVGTNYLFEGRKLWTFFPPDELETPMNTASSNNNNDGSSSSSSNVYHSKASHDSDAALEQERGYPSATTLFKARRQSPDAWGVHSFSAGWVSPVDLYRYPIGIHNGMHNNNDHDSTGSISSSVDNVICSLDQVLASRTTTNNNNTSTSTDTTTDTPYHTDNKATTTTDTSYHTDNHTDNKATIPSDINYRFKSSDVDVDHCDCRSIQGVVQVIQEEGDLIIIPPRWWHQVYNLQPSIAIANQIMEKSVKDRVIDHMLQWNDINRSNTELLSPNFDLLSPRNQIFATLEACLIHRFGRDRGLKELRRLMVSGRWEGSNRVGHSAMDRGEIASSDNESNSSRSSSSDGTERMDFDINSLPPTHMNSDYYDNDDDDDDDDGNYVHEQDLIYEEIDYDDDDGFEVYYLTDEEDDEEAGLGLGLDDEHGESATAGVGFLPYGSSSSSSSSSSSDGKTSSPPLQLPLQKKARKKNKLRSLLRRNRVRNRIARREIM